MADADGAERAAASEEQAPVVLLVDDTPTNLQVLFKTLNGRGYKLLAAKDGESALEIAAKARPALILLDIMMPGIDGYETCRRLKAQPETADAAIIFCSALDEASDKVKGFDLGAVDYVAKPYEASEIVARVETHLTIQRLQTDLQARNRELERQLRVSQELVHDAGVRVEGPLLGESAAVRSLRARVQASGADDRPVLLSGPAGAGREAVAHAVHDASGRGHRAFITLHCMALGGDAKDTLFGARGSLLKLGSDRKPGKWDLAEGGTLFLDRIDALPAATQKALLSRLEDASRSGAGYAVRLVAYTGHDLGELSQAGAFDPALHERLAAHAISLPPLAERPDDLPALVEHFLQRLASRLGKTVERVSKASLKRLLKHSWPGDVQELQSVLECALIAAEGRELEVDEALLAGGGRVGSYQLIERLGAGGMGEVWRGQHELLRRPAAVKLIASKHTQDLGQRDTALKRFEREAHATASLRSPNTVQLYDYGVSDGGEIYYVMELLRGLDVDSLVKQFGPLPVERAVHLLRQACRSLGEAHSAGLVHRDIKPANLFASILGPEFDVLKILDFGVVKAEANPDDVNLTGTEVVGSPAFMSPELVLGERDVDGRADLYSLGCVAYWMLAAQPVFKADSPTAMCVAHATAEPRPLSLLSDAAIPQALEDVVMACLAKQPADRPGSAAELWQRLGEVPLAEPWTPGRAESWWRGNLPEKAGD